jgi:hypothetical protein
VYTLRLLLILGRSALESSDTGSLGLTRNAATSAVL